MSEKPSSTARAVKEPQDHLPPIQAEAEGTDVAVVEFDGHTFTFPSDSMDWSNDARRAFIAGIVDEGVPLLLGDQFTKAGGGTWSGRKVHELAVEIGKANGFGSAGE